MADNSALQTPRDEKWNNPQKSAWGRECEARERPWLFMNPRAPARSVDKWPHWRHAFSPQASTTAKDHSPAPSATQLASRHTVRQNTGVPFPAFCSCSPHEPSNMRLSCFCPCFDEAMVRETHSLRSLGHNTGTFTLNCFTLHYKVNTLSCYWYRLQVPGLVRQPNSCTVHTVRTRWPLKGPRINSIAPQGNPSIDHRAISNATPPKHTHTRTRLQFKRAQHGFLVSDSSSVGTSNKTEHVRRQ